MLSYLKLVALIYVHFPLSYYFKIHRLLFIKTNPQLELGECRNRNWRFRASRSGSKVKGNKKQDVLLW